MRVPTPADLAAILDNLPEPPVLPEPALPVEPARSIATTVAALCAIDVQPVSGSNRRWVFTFKDGSKLVTQDPDHAQTLIHQLLPVVARTNHDQAG